MEEKYKMGTGTRRIMNMTQWYDDICQHWKWETNTHRMKPKILAKFSQLYLDESVKDEKKFKKNKFQDLRGPVTVPNEPKVAYWLRRKKRENASEKTFFVRPQRPLRFRTIPPLLLPALYALPAIIGGIKMYFTKISCCIVLTFQEWVLAWFSSARGNSLLQPCTPRLLPVRGCSYIT